MARWKGFFNESAHPSAEGGGGDKIDIYHLGHHKALKMSCSIYWETKNRWTIHTMSLEQWKKTQQVFFHSKATETEISESLFVAPEPFSTEVGIRAMGTF